MCKKIWLATPQLVLRLRFTCTFPSCSSLQFQHKTHTIRALFYLLLHSPHANKITEESSTSVISVRKRQLGVTLLDRRRHLRIRIRSFFTRTVFQFSRLIRGNSSSLSPNLLLIGCMCMCMLYVWILDLGMMRCDPPLIDLTFYFS